MQETFKIFQYQGNDRLILPACRESFTVLQEWLGEIADSLNLSSRDKRQILISCDEIFTNIASYAYAGTPETGSVEITVMFDQTAVQLKIEFRDKGAEFNPLNTQPPDVSQPLSERKVGGLGLFMVKKMMDKVEYERQGDCNVLTLTKSFAGGTK